MSEPDFEAQLRSVAAGMSYPRTPNISGFVNTRLRSSSRPRFVPKAVAWSLTFGVLLLFSLMLIPPARAAILEFIQVGVVRIFRADSISVTPAIEPAPAPILEFTPQPLIPLLENLGGEMTLEEARQRVDYPILLPSYPDDLGQPDRIFVQDTDGMMTILVWLDPQSPNRPKMSLHFLPAGSWAVKKVQPNVIQETTVNDHYAIWTTGPYPLRLENDDIQFTRLINGHVLIWEDGDITYRLETALPLDEAIKIAESLEPIP